MPILDYKCGKSASPSKSRQKISMKFGLNAFPGKGHLSCTFGLSLLSGFEEVNKYEKKNKLSKKMGCGGSLTRKICWPSTGQPPTAVQPKLSEWVSRALHPTRHSIGH